MITRFKTSTSVKELGALMKLHKMVVHEKRGTTKQYFLESKKLEQVTDEVAKLVCSKCF